MQFVTVGRKVELVDRPIFNWILMGALGAIGTGMFVWTATALPEMTAFERNVASAPLMAFGAMALIGFATLLLHPTRIHSFDPQQGVVSARLEFLFGLVTAPRVLSDVARAEAQTVEGPGPEAYWVYLVSKDGRRRKIRRGAFTPEATEAVLALFAETLRNTGRRTAMVDTARSMGAAGARPGPSNPGPAKPTGPGPRPRPGPAGATPQGSFGRAR